MIDEVLRWVIGLSPKRRSQLIAAVLLPPILVALLLIGVGTGQAQLIAWVLLIALLGVGGVVFVALRSRYRALRIESTRGAEHAYVLGADAQSVLTAGRVVNTRTEHAQILRWHVTLGRVPTRSVIAHGLASGARIAREHLALRATRWRHDSESLVTIFTSSQSDSDISLALGDVDLDVLRGFARVIDAHPRTDKDEAASLAIFTWLAAGGPGLTELSRVDVAARLLIAGDRGRALPVVAGIDEHSEFRRWFALDLINPWADSAAASSSESLWRESFTAIFRRAGLEGIELRPDGPTPFERLEARPTQRNDSGPLISVIMTCFEPTKALETAVRSMLRQSWQNWELLIMDDGSSSTAILDQVALWDPRIQVVKAPDNQGTYIRRNEGIALARGEFIAVQDSDDWVHPRRLEIQAHHLMGDPEEYANTSQCLRLTDRLELSHVRGTNLRLNESSIMFRREPVLEVIGWFDPVRKAADSEFRLRLNAAVSRETPLLKVGAPLAFVRSNARSLSGSDLGDGWMHPARVAYRGAQSEWRRQQARAGGSFHVAPTSKERAWPAHPHLTTGGSVHHDLDVVFVLDTRMRAATEKTVQDAAGELEAMALAGRRVGFRSAQALAPERPSPDTASALQRLVNAGRIHEVLPTDSCAAELVVVRMRESLLGVGDKDHHIDTARVIVVRDGAALPDSVVRDALARLAPGATVDEQEVGDIRAYGSVADDPAG